MLTALKRETTKLPSKEEVEFADHIIWLNDFFMVFQLKERVGTSSSTQEDETKWFTKKVLGKATKQIRDSIHYLDNQENISIRNQRGHEFILDPSSITTIIKIVLYLPGEALPQKEFSIKYHDSKSIGFIHVLSLQDYLGICQTLITPVEIKKYFLFRKDVFQKWPKEINVWEASLVGQFLYGEFDECPNNDYLPYYKSFLNSKDEFDISHFLDEIANHIDFGKSNIKETEYYRLLEEFAKLNRSEWALIKERINLCLDASKANEYRDPYRITLPSSQCNFIFIPITEKFYKERLSVLQSLALISKYEQKTNKCIGLTFAYNNNQFQIDFIYGNFPRV